MKETRRTICNVLLGCLAALLFLSVAGPALAVPQHVTYSGRLSDGTGWGMSTEVDLQVVLYRCECGAGDGCSAPCDPGDDGEVWSSGFSGVPVDNGYFSVRLESGVDPDQQPLNVTDAFVAHEAVWVAVVVDGNEVSPRQAVGGVPYAVMARAAETARRVEIVAGVTRYSVNAVFRGSTAGALTSADGNFEDDGSTRGYIGVNGVAAGYPSAKRACEIALGSPTAHMCSSHEMMISAQMGLLSFSSYIWVSSGTAAGRYDPTGTTYHRYYDCEGWQQDTSACVGSQVCLGLVWTQNQPTEDSCDSLRPVACCDH